MATRPPKAAVDGAKSTYTVKSVVTHDGDSYDVGQSIDLTDKLAEALLAVDAIAADDGGAQDKA